MGIEKESVGRQQLEGREAGGPGGKREGLSKQNKTKPKPHRCSQQYGDYQREEGGGGRGG